MESPPTVLHWRPVVVPSLWFWVQEPSVGFEVLIYQLGSPLLPLALTSACCGCLDGGPDAADHQPGHI